MDKTTKQRLEEILRLKRNPMADSNNFMKLKEQISWMNLVTMTDEERRMVSEICE